MDVKELLESHRETKKKLAGVLQELNTFRKRAKNEPEEQAHCFKAFKQCWRDYAKACGVKK